MKNYILINLEKENIQGNVLDIGCSNYGIIYNLFKNGCDEISVDYVSGREEKNKIEKEFYDSCIIFFSLSNIWLKYNRKKVLYDITKNIKPDGLLYIWDTDKKYGKMFNGTLKVILPGKEFKNIKINDRNILKDTSFSSTKKMFEKYFEIVDYKCSDNIYFIKGKKRGN